LSNQRSSPQMSASRPHGLDVQSDDDHDEWPDIDLTDDMAAAERSAADVEEIGALAVRTHRERDDPTTNDNADNPASSSSSPSYNSSEDEEFQSFSGDVFVRHRVHQKDTLASLAVRYNVSISDIKRTNAYQNDSALYGKEWVIIPKKPLPIDLELLGDVYNKTLCSPRGVRTLMVAHMEYLDDDERDAARLRASERRDGHGREREGTVEVELMRTTMASTSTASTSRASTSLPTTSRDFRDARTRITVSRADSHELYDPATREFFDALREKDAANSTPQIFSAETTAKLNAWKERSSSMAMKELKNFQGRSIRWRDTLVNKLKRIGSQPALGGGGVGGSVSGHVRASSVDETLGLKKD
jgi:LysM repeat protein